jgi:hypothetical protein
VAFLTKELGTDNFERAKSYLEEPLRMTAHLVMRTPEYQIVRTRRSRVAAAGIKLSWISG